MVRAAAITIGLFVTTSVMAIGADLGQAEQLVQDGQYQAAYDLLAPLEAEHPEDARFYELLGQAALNTDHADSAVRFFHRSLELSPDSINAHLGLARAYMAMGNYTAAKIQFETVLRIDHLPADLHQQVEIYAAAARDYADGQRLFPFAYLLTGLGNYSVNATAGTDEFGGSDTDDNFYSLRGGVGLTYELDDNYAINGSLDYRYRNYEGDRRDDKDLRWNAAVNRSLGENNLALGVRGRNSYRGNGDYRNDYGIYGDWRIAASAIDQFNLGVEFRRRNYPRGPLRARSRNILEFTAGWTHALLDGSAAFSLVASGGREYATDDRPDGDSNFFGLSPSLSLTFTDTLGGFVFGWWQRQRYNIENLNVDGADEILGILTRNDNLWEVGGGLSWQFRPSWSLNPEIVYIRDYSNILANNYSSTEIWATLRKDF